MTAMPRTMYNGPAREMPAVMSASAIEVTDLVVTVPFFGEVVEHELLTREFVRVALRDEISGEFAGAFILSAGRELGVRRLAMAGRHG